MAKWTVVAWMMAAGCTTGDDRPVVPDEVDAGRGSRDAGQPLTDGDVPDRDAGPSIVTADPPPPPITGGTLLVTRDGLRAVAADPDRDRVWIASLADYTLEGSVILEPGDEPGRLVEDAEGRVHVALRGGGAVAWIDAAAAAVVARRPVCGAPRGIDYDPRLDAIHVACAGGELVTLPAPGGDATRTLQLDRDLRDVVVEGDRLFVTRLRSAELLILAADGSIVTRSTPVDATVATGRGPADLVPRVAWRAVRRPGGGVAVLHQRAISSELAIETGGYSGLGCSAGIVHAAVTVFDSDGAPSDAAALTGSALIVDVAWSPDGETVAVATAARNDGLAALELPSHAVTSSTVADCVGAGGRSASDAAGIAVAYTNDALVIQTRQPAAILVRGDAGEHRIALDGAVDVTDSGHDLFHTGGRTQMTCAGCHPEGADDGHVWDFGGTGLRRTQSLLGGVLSTAPFHWSGDQPDLGDIMQATFVERMGGGDVSPAQVDALGAWLDAQPAVRATPSDAAAVERGRTVFETAAGCAGCHAGAMLTDNRTVDVGTGAPFQVPSLVGVALRAPYLHDGCAATLEATLDGTCMPAGVHGDTAALSAADVADLIAYVASL